MKTKNIFKALVLAAVLVSACSKNDIADDFKGYSLPVTINVTRQGDEPATRATYDESKRKLSFSAGDKLFVAGSDSKAGDFAGLLAWQSKGTFSGTIMTEKEYDGTAEELLSSATDAEALLIPAGYKSYEYLGLDDEITPYAGYYQNKTNAFALTKAAAVEQFSFELAEAYSSGFTLSPQNAIVSFTISELTANKEVAVSFDTYLCGVINKSVTTSAEGVATFAIGLDADIPLENCTLTVDGKNIAMPTKTVEAGHIYNISRSVAPAGPTAYTLTASTVGMIAGSNGKAYAAADKDNLPDGVTAVGMVAYKGKYDASTGSVIALTDESESKMSWAAAQTACTNKASVGGYSWKIPDTWMFMFESFGGNESNCTGLNTALVNAGGNALKSGYYSVSYWIDSAGEGNIMYVNSDGSTASYSWADPSYLRLYFEFDE